MGSAARSSRLAGLTLALAGAVLADACGGAGAGGPCPTLSDCGGDPTGVWEVTNACSFQAYNKPSVATVPADYGVPSPAPGSGDWCWSLAIKPDGTIGNATPAPMNGVTIGPVNSVNPGASTVDVDIINSGTVCFNADHTYLYTLTGVSKDNDVYFARSCLGVNGATMTCGDLTSALTTYFMGENPQYYNFACSAVGEDCNCTFDFTESPNANGSAAGTTGTWTLQNGLIWTFADITQGYSNLSYGSHTVLQTDYCVSPDGNTLQLTGYRGTPIQLHAGLRTLTLKKVDGPCPQ
jgi:hypothetical protein